MVRSMEERKRKENEMVVFGKIQIEQNRMSQVDRSCRRKCREEFFCSVVKEKSAKGIYI